MDRVLLCSTVDSEIFARILFSRIALNDIFAPSKILQGHNLNIPVFATSRGFYMRSFAKIKSSRKFPNIQYVVSFLILMRKRELVTLLQLSSWYLVTISMISVSWLFLAVPLVGLQCVIVVQ